jgi:hypothetical protein
MLVNDYLVNLFIKYKDTLPKKTIIERAIREGYNVHDVTEAAEVSEATELSKNTDVPTIPLKIAAMEVLKWVKYLQYASIATMAAPFIALIAYILSKPVGYGAVTIACGLGAYGMYTAQKELKRLRGKYTI